VPIPAIRVVSVGTGRIEKKQWMNLVSADPHVRTAVVDRLRRG
jgi:hypothetical protein